MAAMFNDRSTPLSLLATRRSGKPRDLAAPGPDDAQLARILEIAARTPDHGKLAPWRFVIVPADRRARLLSITEAGQRARRAVQAEIQANEERVLSRLPAADREAFLRVAQALSALPPGEFTGSGG